MNPVEFNLITADSDEFDRPPHMPTFTINPE